VARSAAATPARVGLGGDGIGRTAPFLARPIQLCRLRGYFRRRLCMRVMDDFSAVTAHSITGNTLSIAANRLSYVFDCMGPRSRSIPPAPHRSSLCTRPANSLRAGEAATALVGGVNLLLILIRSSASQGFDALGERPAAALSMRPPTLCAG